MKSYAILMFLVIFSGVISILNAIGAWPAVDLPTWIVPSLAEENILGMQDSLLETPIYLATTLVGTGINVLVTALASILGIGFLLYFLGVPAIIATTIQGIIYIIYVWDLVNWFFNKPR